MSSNVKIPVPVMPHRPARASADMLSTIDAARAAESYGYERFASTHNAGSLLSSATVGHGGDRCRNRGVFAWVRSGVLPQPRTLRGERFEPVAFHPGRIDLGVGRAPGTDPMTAAALRRDSSAAMGFPAEVQQLQRFLGRPHSPMPHYFSFQPGLEVPLYILGSSLRSLPHSWVTLRVRFAFCARNAAGGGRHLPRKLQALRAPGTALHGGCNRNARRYRRASTRPSNSISGRGARPICLCSVEDMDAVWTDAGRCTLNTDRQKQS